LQIQLSGPDNEFSGYPARYLEISKEKRKMAWLIKDALTKDPLRRFLCLRVDFEGIF